MSSVLKKLNKIMYENLFHIDLDLQSNFLEQFTSFQFNQRNKNLIIVHLLYLLSMSIPRVFYNANYATTYFYSYSSEQTQKIIVLMYVLFILEFLTIAILLVLFGIASASLQLKLAMSGWRTYIHDGLLTFLTFIRCSIIILRTINQDCVDIDFCRSILPSVTLVMLKLSLSLFPIFLPLIYGGVQFSTVLINFFIIVMTLVVGNNISGSWISQLIYMITSYTLFIPICIFQIYIIQFNNFLLTKSRTSNEEIREDLENPINESIIENYEDIDINSMHKNILSQVHENESISPIPSTDDNSTETNYPIIESPRNLNDFSIFYEFYEQEYLIALYELKSGKISDTSSIWKLFPHLALPQLYTEKDREGYGLKSLPEATSFLLDLTLGPKLMLLLNTLLDKLNDSDEIKLQRLLGSYNNAMILLSCTTLFFYSSFGTNYNRVFEILMRKCREELHANDPETQLFCSESANCYR